jgi:hypothetical protein
LEAAPRAQQHHQLTAQHDAHDVLLAVSSTANDSKAVVHCTSQHLQDAANALHARKRYGWLACCFYCCDVAHQAVWVGFEVWQLLQVDEGFVDWLDTCAVTHRL